MSASRIRYRLNVRAALALAALAGAAALGLYALWGYQEGRVLRAAMAEIRGFRDAGARATEPDRRGTSYDLALRHLGQYLTFRPDDPEALEIQAQLMAVRGGDFLGVASVYDHLLRVEPEGPRAQDARRRLVELYIAYSEMYKQSRGAQLLPEETAKYLRYNVAELRADQLLDPRARPRVDDAEAHRLRALALEGQISPEKTRRVIAAGRGGDVVFDLLQGAIDEYEAALKREPGDLVAANRLAGLYRGYRNDTTAALRVLDGLLKARPDSVDARLIRYSFLKKIGDDAAAFRDLEAAIALAPENFLVIQLGVFDALQGERRDIDRARRWLARVPAQLRDDPRVLTLEGTIDYAAHNPAAAINTWFRGLERSNGSDRELTWWLAYASLEMGREADARKYTDQYRQIAGGGDDPLLQLLEALRDEREGRYSRAVERLESAGDRLGEAMREQIRLVLGRCQEKLGDAEEAGRTYRAALELEPKSLPLRLSLAQLLLKSRQHDEAVKLLEQGLRSMPNQPALLIYLAEAEFRRQSSRPASRRNWADFDATYKRAAEAAPGDPALAMIQAERLSAEGGVDRAIELLEQNAARPDNRAAPLIAIPLADNLLHQGRNDEALRVLERASARADRGALRTARARILGLLGRGREARALLLKDLDRLPPDDRGEVWNALFLICRAQADPKTTRDALEEWARQLPDDPRPKLGLLDLAIEGGDEAAVLALLGTIRPSDARGEGDPTWLLAEARVKLWRRSHIKADAGERAAPAPEAGSKAKTPASAATAERAALLGDADALVERVLRETKFDPQALLLKGAIYQETGDEERAADAYSRAWAHGNPQALPLLVEILTRLGRKEELARLRQSDRMNVLDRIEALALLRRGDKDQAVQVVEQSLRDQPGNPSWQVGMLQALDQGKKAESVLRASAERQPGQLEPWLALLQFQAGHGEAAAVEATIAEIKRQVKDVPPELLEARCRSAVGDRPGADKAYDEALRRLPDAREVLMAAALHFEATGRPDRAEACLRRVLEKDPGQRPAARQLALILAMRPGTWAQAAKALGPEDPARDTPEDRLTRGLVLARGPSPDDRKRAQEILEALTSDLPAGAPAAASARDVLARLLLATNQARRASEVAAVSATGGSAGAAAIALYAEALLLDGQLDAAEAQLNRLAGIKAGVGIEANLRARLIQARAKKDKSGPAAAAEKLEQAYRARENTPGAEAFGREAFAMLLTMGPDALDAAERLGHRLAGRAPSLSWMPALALGRRGRNDEALALCLAAARDGRNRADLYEACRVALQVAVGSRTDGGTLRRADEVLAAALKHAPDSDEVQVMDAMLRHLQGRFDDEVRLYRGVVARQPRNPVVLNNLAWALSEGLNQPSEALERADDLLRVAGRNSESLDTRGVILSRLGRLDEAARELEEAARVDPTGLRHYHLAQVYRKMGREADFRKALAEVRKAGLTAASIDPTERAEFEALINP